MCGQGSKVGGAVGEGDEHSRGNLGRKHMLGRILEDLEIRPRNPAFILHVPCTIEGCHCFRRMNLSVVCSEGKDREAGGRNAS